jgi:hypothetical protein
MRFLSERGSNFPENKNRKRGIETACGNSRTTKKLKPNND